jgi:hypothetical protein
MGPFRSFAAPGVEYDEPELARLDASAGAWRRERGGSLVATDVAGMADSRGEGKVGMAADIGSVRLR